MQKLFSGETLLGIKADRILGATAAAVAAATGSGMVGTQAECAADIVYSGVVNIDVPITTAGVYLNVVSGVFNTSPASAPGWDMNPWSTTALNWFNPTAPAGGVYVIGSDAGVDNLATGTLIGAGSVFGSGASQTTGATAFNLNSSNNLVGFRFQNEANGNQTHYGWVRVSLGGTLTSPRALVEYAYDDIAGTSIAAGDIGAIPEPSTFGLLAAGAMGLATFRRRRRAV